MRGTSLVTASRSEKGVRILAPIIGVKRKPNEEAEKDITKQNTLVLVGLRNAYVFDVEQTEGVELPTMPEVLRIPVMSIRDTG